MEYQGPYYYQLFIAGLENARVCERKEQNGQEVNFQTPVTNDKQPKIYIIHSNKEIVYVGYAGQPIGNRLRGGLKASGKNGYHGYQWKHLFHVDLSVFVFEPFVGNHEIDDNRKLFVEAVEAEIVYLVRTKSGFWPKYQHEIHFNNDSPEEVRMIAGEIFKKVKEEEYNKD